MGAKRNSPTSLPDFLRGKLWFLLKQEGMELNKHVKFNLPSFHCTQQEPQPHTSLDDKKHPDSRQGSPKTCGTCPGALVPTQTSWLHFYLQEAQRQDPLDTSHSSLQSSRRCGHSRKSSLCMLFSKIPTVRKTRSSLMCCKNKSETAVQIKN